MTIEEIIKEAFSRGWNASHECATDFDYDCALNGFLSEVETEVKKFRIGAVSGSLPSKDEAVNVGFRKATVEGYNYRRVCREPDHDIYYSGWMDCYDWLSGNDR